MKTDSCSVEAGSIRLQPLAVPVYARASLPIHVEPSPVVVGLRAAAGLELGFVAFSLYLEGAADFSLVSLEQGEV